MEDWRQLFKMKKLILATTSIPRKQAFNELNIPYEAVGSDVNEYFEGRPDNPRALVLCLAKLKAENVQKKILNPDSIVIGFDSVGYFNNQILEKPKTKEEAFNRLQNYSDNNYEFFTGIHLIDNEYTQSKLVETKVQMRNLSFGEIKKYLHDDPNYRRYALGFDPLNTFGSSLIKSIEGSYNNILRGIPLETIVEMLIERGFNLK